MRDQFFHELEYESTGQSPSLALVSLLALWRDAHLTDDREVLEAFRNALSEHVLSGGRRDFEPPELWMPHEDTTDHAPQFEGPLIHYRLFDIANEGHKWATHKLATGQSQPPVLPQVTTADASLRSLLATFGADKLVNERQ
jgi:hypothetical protein